MFVDEIKRAAETAARIELPAVSAALWKAFGAGQISEAEAATLSDLIEARKAVQAAAAPPRRAIGSRPRTSASLERRRRWAASGRLPPALAARFTTAEVAALAVIAAETARHGRCTLAHAHIAAVAGVSVSTVKRAVKAARDCALLEVQVRRVSAFRNDTNVVAIISREWLSWLRLARTGGGVQNRTGTPTLFSRTEKKGPVEKVKGSAGEQGRKHLGGRLDSHRMAEAAGAM
ncbi:hypothetical protein BK022_23715 [Methylorubrum extorquens]|uniref:Helix-turn-helix domain-containing protein n=1 Tax=Methylorubrum extorquens TaxID=408 RepID=A0A1S1NVR3_METEX|nr:hypothetical protein BK022_23715 [Methylorubrum extorquens]